MADRSARLSAPVGHSAALLSCLGWGLATGDWHLALTSAVAVLISTCPCGLGLAVPMVQVVAARRLFEHGIMVKDGSAMERLVEIDTIVFDKTGTLTMGLPGLRRDVPADQANLAITARIGAHSHHPNAPALSAATTSAAHAFEHGRRTWGGR